MKTAREILLRRHQAVESKLDRIRSDVLAELSSDASVTCEILNQSYSSPALRAPSPPLGAGERDGVRGRSSNRSNPVFEFAVTLWLELIWPCRRVWTGLAAVWLALLVFNVATTDSGGKAGRSVAVTSPEMWMSIQEQRRLFAELSQLLPAERPKPAPSDPAKPRSEARRAFSAA